MKYGLCFQPSLPGGQKPRYFSQPDVIWVPFPVLILWAGGPDLGFRPHTFQRNLPAAVYPSGTLAVTHECLFSLLMPPHLLPVSTWPPLEVLGYKASLLLVFSWLFRKICLYFTCNSSLVRAGGECSFHLICCHIGSLSQFLHLYDNKDMMALEYCEIINWSGTILV